jgi:hypothetical protein
VYHKKIKAMKIRNYGMAVLALTAFIACQKDISNTVPTTPRVVNLMDTVSIKMAETVSIGDFSIKLDSMADSRCPTNANCIWAGVADAKLVVKRGMDSQIVRLKNVQKFDTATVFSRQLRLLNVSPYPNSTTPIPQGDYVIKLVVQ